MKNFKNLNEVRETINLYFDDALNSQDQMDLLNRIDEDQRCQKIFHQEKNMRNFIKNNVTRSSVSPDLIQNIKNHIRVV